MKWNALNMSRTVSQGRRHKNFDLHPFEGGRASVLRVVSIVSVLEIGIPNIGHLIARQSNN